jgi:hypothetical protein
MRFKTGPGWVRHLRLPDEVFVEDSFTDVPAQEPASHDSTVVAGLDPLIDALGRFEAVSANPDYRVVSKLPAFKTTHQRLSGYLDLLSEAPEDIPLEGPLLELVPTPEPVED